MNSNNCNIFEIDLTRIKTFVHIFRVSIATYSLLYASEFGRPIGFLSVSTKKKRIVFINEGVLKFSVKNQLRGIDESHDFCLC